MGDKDGAATFGKLGRTVKEHSHKKHFKCYNVLRRDFSTAIHSY